MQITQKSHHNPYTTLHDIPKYYAVLKRLSMMWSYIPSNPRMNLCKLSRFVHKLNLRGGISWSKWQEANLILKNAVAFFTPGPLTKEVFCNSNNTNTRYRRYPCLQECSTTDHDSSKQRRHSILRIIYHGWPQYATYGITPMEQSPIIHHGFSPHSNELERSWHTLSLLFPPGVDLPFPSNMVIGKFSGEDSLPFNIDNTQ